MSVELVFGDAFSSVELFDAALYFGIDSFAIFGEPAILFLLGFQQAEQNLFNGAGAGRLELLLDPRFQFRISNFNGHSLYLVPKARDSFSS